MHGMLSLAVLVAAFAALAGWAVFVSVRLYRACAAARAVQPHLPGRSSQTVDADSADAGTRHMVS
jgi:hypothetical protein